MRTTEPLITTRKTNVAFFLIFAFSVVIKSTVFIFSADPIIFNKYPYFAERIAGGMDIGERLLDLSPLYLYSVKTFYALFGPNWDMLISQQIILGSFTCTLLGLIGARVFNPAVGIITAGIILLYGNMTLIELTLEPEALLLFLNSLTILALLWAGKEAAGQKKITAWLVSGALIGLAAATKANALLILPGAAVWIWLSLKTGKYRAWGSLLLGALLVIAPVAVRNFVQFNDCVLLTADGGKVFFHGNGPGATGMERADLPDQGFIEEGQGEPDYAHALFRQKAREEAHAHLKPSECSSYWVLETVKYMAAHSRASLANFSKKFILFWNNYEVHDLDTTYKSYKTISQWPFLTAGIIAALGLLGMMVPTGFDRKAFLLYWMVFIYLISVVVFFSASRYRLPAFSFLAIFAARFLYYFWELVKNKDIKRAAVALVLLCISLAFSYLPFKDEIASFDRWQQISRVDYSLGGRMLFNAGKYEEAARKFEQVVASAPDFTPAVNYLGKSYAILGKHDKAAACFRRVIRLSPNVDEGYLNAGLLCELRGKKKEAARYFEKALALNPQNVKAREHQKESKTN
jgi:tetratricopeptide (TPR) repeat protein